MWAFPLSVVDLLDWFGIHPSLRWITPAYLPSGLTDLQGNTLYAPGWHFGFNWPALIIVMLLTMVLVRGIRESAEANNVMVLLKIVAILIFVGFGMHFIHPANWHPFSPNGWPGILTGGSIVFFTYIGFDSVSTAAEECKNPQRDLPIGIIATLVICTVLYIAVVVVLTGLVPWQTLLDGRSSGCEHYEASPLWWSGNCRPARCVAAGDDLVAARLPAGMQAFRAVWSAATLSRDGLLPGIFSREIHKTYRTPDFSTWVAGFVVGVPSRPAGYWNTGRPIWNIGTLFRICARRGRRPDPSLS